MGNVSLFAGQLSQKRWQNVADTAAGYDKHCGSKSIVMSICKVFLFRHLLIYCRLSTQQVCSSVPCWPTFNLI